jgi:putative transposase
VLTVVDQWSRQSPVLEAAQRFSGSDVAVVLDRVIGPGRSPRSITVDHDPDGVHDPRQEQRTEEVALL